MNPKLFLLSVVTGCLLVGCATTDPPTIVVVETPLIHPPLPRKLSLKPVEWEIVNVSTNSYFALDAANYSNLSKNMSDVIGYIEKLRTIIQYYHHVRPDGATNTTHTSTNIVSTATNTTPKVAITTKPGTNTVSNGNWFTRMFGGKPESAPLK